MVAAAYLTALHHTAQHSTQMVVECTHRYGPVQESKFGTLQAEMYLVTSEMEIPIQTLGVHQLQTSPAATLMASSGI